MFLKNRSIQAFLFASSLLAVIFLVNQPALAQSEEETTSVIQNLAQPCMDCGSCTFEDFLIVFKNMANLGLSLIGPLLVLILIIAGLVFLFSGGNQGLVDRGKKIISGALVGMTIVFSAWLIINTIVTISVKNQKIFGTEWFSYNTVANPLACPQLAVTTDSNITTTEQESICASPGSQCTPLSCDPVRPGDGCDKNAVNKLKPQIREGVARSKVGGTCSGIDMVKLIEAISANESDGNITKISPKGAAGPFQMKPDTAFQYKKSCKKWGESGYFTPDNPKDKNGNIIPKNWNEWLGWLTKEENIAGQACIATKFITKSLARVCGCNVRQIAAGYNGGAAGACGNSADCGSCQMCPNQKQTTKKWECLWNNPQHTACNTGLVETRNYAPWVEWCYNNAF